MNDEMVKVVYWPDGVWCYDEEKHSMTHRSDDYGFLSLPAGCTEEDIDSSVILALSGKPFGTS
jgi:hypothetical protein